MAFTWDQIKGWTYDELYTELCKTPEAQELRAKAIARLAEYTIDRVEVAGSNGVEPSLYVFLRDHERYVAHTSSSWKRAGALVVAKEYIEDRKYHWIDLPSVWLGESNQSEDIYKKYVGPGKLIPKVPVRCREGTVLHGTSSRRAGPSLSEFISNWITNSTKEEQQVVQEKLKQQVLRIISDPDWLVEYRKKRIHFAIKNVATALREYRVLGPEVLQEALNLVFIEEVHEA